MSTPTLLFILGTAVAGFGVVFSYKYNLQFGIALNSFAAGVNFAYFLGSMVIH